MAKTNAEKQADFRKRQQDDLSRLRAVRDMVAGRSVPSNETERPIWFNITLNVDRPELKKRAELRYVMEASEVSCLLADLERHKLTGNPASGTYAYGQYGDGPISGIITLAFDGVTLGNASKLDEYEPHCQSSYQITKCAVSLIRH